MRLYAKDMLQLAVNEKLHQGNISAVFVAQYNDNNNNDIGGVASKLEGN